VHPPIPSEEFDQSEMLAAEKEAIGLFVSEHPLKPLRDALRKRVDCSVSALADRRDKDLVTVGGIITETRRIRTRAGDHMMFATLDDLAGSVELLVFAKSMAEHEPVLVADAIVLVKGRVDHKEAGSTTLVVQSVQRFAPSREEIESARTQADAAARAAETQSRTVHLRVKAEQLSNGKLDGLKQALEEYPGAAEVVIDIEGRDGTRRFRLGEAYRVTHTPTLLAELEHALAPVISTAFAA
jgi:DNA polymerase-3 subunit alpha